MELASQIATLLAILGALVSIAVVVRQRQLAPPKVSFEFGISRDLRRFLPFTERRRACRTVAYGLPEDENAVYIIGLPFFLENHGRKPIQNLTLQLEYPNDFRVPDLEKLRREFENVIDFKKDLWACRSVSSTSRYAQARLEIGTLRPGEKTTVFEPIVVLPAPRKTQANSTSSYQMATKSCADSSPRFFSLCPIRAYLYSDDLPPLVREFLVLCVRAPSIQEATNALGKVVEGLWDGTYPRPGIDIKYPWEKLLVKELAQVYVPKFKNAGSELSIEVDPQGSDTTNVTVVLPESHPFGRLHNF